MTTRSNWACGSLSLTWWRLIGPDCANRNFIPGGITFPAAGLGQRESQQVKQSNMKTNKKFIHHNHHQDGLDRRGFLECMAWAGTGMLWTVSGGLLGSTLLPSSTGAAEAAKGSFSFVQISDSHIGFNKPGINTDVTATLRQAIA